MNTIDNVQAMIKGLEGNTIIDTEGNFAKEMWFLIQHGQKIPAIKKIRAAVGAMEFGLKEAKDFVEELTEKFRTTTTNGYPLNLYTYMDAFHKVFDATLKLHLVSREERLANRNIELTRQNFTLRDKVERLEHEMLRLKDRLTELTTAKDESQEPDEDDLDFCDCPTCIREREDSN